MGYSVRPSIYPNGVFRSSAHFTPYYKQKYGVFRLRTIYPTWGIWSVRTFYPTNMGYLVSPHILPHIVHILPHKHGVFGPSAHFTPCPPILPHIMHKNMGYLVCGPKTPHIISKNMWDRKKKTHWQNVFSFCGFFCLLPLTWFFDHFQ